MGCFNDREIIHDEVIRYGCVNSYYCQEEYRHDDYDRCGGCGGYNGYNGYDRIERYDDFDDGCCRRKRRNCGICGIFGGSYGHGRGY